MSEPTLLRLFNDALEIESPEDRDLFLEQACADDNQLRQRVKELLSADPGAGRFLKSNPADLPETHASGLNLATDARLVGTKIGRYKIREQIGEGGMGAVFVADQTEPVKRRVALKLIRAGLASSDVVGRFEAERQALAMMNHPNIARVLDGGTTDSGQPYFAMELVQGLPITGYCDERKLTNEQRLELFLDVCRAVQHAHQRGIIHRDLKPSNIIVAEIDDKAVIKVIDFGVAKAINQKLTDETVYTQFAQMVGTPLYMSPEQAGLGVLDIDTRSDVYSLGVLLYELLTGNTPFDRETLKSAGYDEMRRMIREDDPRRPSALVSTLDAEARSTVSKMRGTDQRRLSQSLRGELDWIVMKALEKDRKRRYESASALADDIQRSLNGEPVLACPPSALYRIRKVTTRNRQLFAAAGIAAAALVVATLISVLYAIDANDKQFKAIEAERKAQRNLDSAIESIDKLLEHAASSELAELPQAQPIRKRILEDVVTFYRGLLDNAEQTASLRFKATATWKDLGELSIELYEDQQGREALQECLRRAGELVDEDPSDPDYQWLLIDTLQRMGTHEYRMSNFEASRLYLLETLSAIQKCADEKLKSSARVQGAKLITLWWLGNNPEVVDDPQLRERYAAEAIEFAKTQRHNQTEKGCYGLRLVARSLEKKAPDQAAQFYHWMLANSRDWADPSAPRVLFSARIDDLNRAFRFFRWHDGKLATELAIELLQLADRLVADFPNRRWNLIRQEHALRRIFTLREVSDASPELLQEELLRRTQEAPEHHRTHLVRAALLSQDHDPIASLTKAIEENPLRSDYREFRGLIHLDRMQLDKGLEDLSHALAISPEPHRLPNHIAWHANRFTKAQRPHDGIRLIEMVHDYGLVTCDTERSLAYAFRSLGRDEEAESHAEKARKLRATMRQPLQW